MSRIPWLRLHSVRRVLLLCGAAMVAVVLLYPRPPAARAADPPEALVKADALFKEQHWKEAAAAYTEVLSKRQAPEYAWRASTQRMAAHLRMGQFDEAVAAAEAMVTRFQGTVREARAERVLGNLYLALPHWGTEKGGKYYRNRHDQGIYKYTYALDRKKAVAHLERARSLYLSLLAKGARVGERESGRVGDRETGGTGDAKRRQAGAGTADSSTPTLQHSNTPDQALWQERLDAQFDLVAAVTRFGPYDQSWGYWWYAWADDDTEDDTVDEFHGLSGGRRDYWSWHNRGRPQGIPVDAEGRPIWDPTPARYSPDLPPGQKMKFLLAEIENEDRGDARDYAALARYRRAMLARARYGPDRLNRYAGWWDGRTNPYGGDIAKKHLYDLDDNEALILLGTRLAVVELPPDEDPVGLLRSVVKEFPRAPMAHEAQYAVGFFFQSREQYTKALGEYARYRDLFPKGDRLDAVGKQETLINKPEVGIQQVGVQLAGDPATLPITYRNAKVIHLKAYTLNLGRFIEDVLDVMRRDGDPERKYYYPELRNLSYALLQIHHPEKEPRYRKYLGSLVAEWDAVVKDDGTHRYAQARLTTPLKDRGCRLIEATVDDGNSSRNLVLLQDLAIVEKNYKGKTLTYVCDARTGQPVAGARMHYFQFWERYEKRGDEKTQRQHWYVSERDAAADENGISLFAGEIRYNGQRPQVITFARAGDDRVAFSGVNWWSAYWQPTRQWTGRRAILFFDRPVYRPGQKVRAKLWVRAYRNGAYEAPAPRSQWVKVFDPQSKELLNREVALDEFGGGTFDFPLEEGAPLGLYRIYPPDTDFAGGSFRVEEYKKPEFEVTVEPSTDLAKLGDKVSGVVRAKYYFGAPVTNATVKYRVYREEYTFTYTEPGPWDWLYGAGYGIPWYAYDWFPWWGYYGCRPAFWYPWWGPAPKPTRELVQEGDARIGEDGTVKFTFDSAPAKEAHPDKDHLYTIEADVRDASRRVISGTGQVKVARQEFYAFVQVDRGYYQPGEQAKVTVRTLTPGGKPVAAKGKVVISRVRYTGENNAKILEEPEQTFEANTDADGRFAFPLKAGKSGQYKVAWEAADGPPNSGGTDSGLPPSSGGRGGGAAGLPPR